MPEEKKCEPDCPVRGAIDFCPCYKVGKNGELRFFESAQERLQEHGGGILHEYLQGKRENRCQE